MDRRSFLKSSSGLGLASVFLNERALAEDMPIPKSNRFVLYLHLGSSCGISSGLVQPLSPGKYPKGWFQNGADGQSINPLINAHVAADQMVFHNYNKFLAPMVKDMCLVNGTAQSLDHNVASVYQKRGTSSPSFAPEWAMAVTQFMRTEERKNPIIVSSGVKTLSVPDITPLQAKNLDDFARITSDLNIIPKGGSSPYVELLKKRFKAANLGTVAVDSSLPQSADYQLSTLNTGLKELNAATADIKTIKDALSADNVKNLVKDCIENDRIANAATNEFREYLALAGILAKTGLANGMSINLLNEDTHEGGADQVTAQNTGGVWALVSLFWKWVNANSLQNDVMIIVSHDFSRTAYNSRWSDNEVVDASGNNRKTVRIPGRDHDLSMGMMFINAGVPKSGRVGFITDTLTPVGTKDTKGTIDSSLTPYTSENMVGSMLMRVFPELYPTERMVRKHWPTFKEIPQIIA